MKLVLDNIHKTLGGNEILRGISLDVEPGTTQVIVGPSGTGKSVTLKHMVGILKPDQGQVLVDGVCVGNARGKALEDVRKKFGLLFQSGALIAWMSVFENVALPLKEHTDLSFDEITERVKNRLDRVGMVEHMNKKPTQLSGGQRKRVGLARAIVHDPQIILYDEPTSGLDPTLSRQVDDLIRKMKAELGVTSVVVTHDMRSAIEVGDSIAMLYEGKVIENSGPEDFLKSTNTIVRQFIDDAKLETQ